MLSIRTFIFNSFEEVTYLIFDEKSKEGAVIDPGMNNQKEIEEFDRFIVSNNISLKYLILTHLHLDHAWGVPHIKSKYNLPVTAHKESEYLGAIIDAQAQMFGMRTSPGKITVDRYISDGDTLTLGKEKLKVLFVPGHSSGDIALYSHESKFLIAGDIIFRGSIGRTDLPGGNFQQLISGIKDKILTLPPDTVIYPGHGPTTTVAEELHNNPFLI